MATNLYSGTSGWAYPTWKPGFYPAALPQKQFLPFYASRMNTVEVNYTFRTLPTPKILETWLGNTPPHFRFSFKAPQRITHFNRLRDCELVLEQFLVSIEPVRDQGKMALILFQLPPSFKADLDRLNAFLALPQLQSRNIAFEFRHESWFTQTVYDRLSAANAALCVAESDDLATPEVHPSSHIACFRLRQNGGYKPAEISAFAKRFELLAETRDVYAYFKHEDEPTGALNAASLLEAAKR
jgi:uncharacterized protein YecE (DUF72 family)